MNYTAKMIEELKELRVLYAELKKENDVKDLLLEEWAMREADSQQQISELKYLLRLTQAWVGAKDLENAIKQALK